jgi:hypothetical protein
MILPTNGKVAVFDDKYNDVKNLLGALSKNAVPYFYFQDEGGEDLPEKPISNIRLVFLDLELVTDGSANPQNIISSIGGRLSKVLEQNSNYVLVYWSTKQQLYGEIIDNAFENGLSNYKPILKISLNKVEALRDVNNTIEYIIKEITKKANDFQVLKVFSFWENLVNDSAGNLVNGFTNFISKDSQWDETAKYILHKLAYAYGGKEVTNLSEIEQIKNAYYTLNHTLIDSIESIVTFKIDSFPEHFKNVITQTYAGVDNFTSQINKKLLISEKKFSANIPGCIFFIEEMLGQESKEIQATFEKTKENQRIPADKKEGAIKKAEIIATKQIRDVTFRHSAFIKNYNIILNDLLKEDCREKRGEIYQEMIKIELNISPICDYAQSKMPCCRMLPGLLIPMQFESCINKNNGFNYMADPKISLNEIDYLLIFDFRFLHSLSESILKKKISNFKLRQQLLADIQLKLGSHVNRAGVLYL